MGKINNSQRKLNKKTKPITHSTQSTPKSASNTNDDKCLKNQSDLENEQKPEETLILLNQAVSPSQLNQELQDPMNTNFNMDPNDLGIEIDFEIKLIENVSDEKLREEKQKINSQGPESNKKQHSWAFENENESFSDNKEKIGRIIDSYGNQESEDQNMREQQNSKPFDNIWDENQGSNDFRQIYGPINLNIPAAFYQINSSQMIEESQELTREERVHRNPPRYNPQLIQRGAERQPGRQMRCGCKNKNCSDNRCVCRKNGRLCGLQCGCICSECRNQVIDPDARNIFENTSSDEDSDSDQNIEFEFKYVPMEFVPPRIGQEMGL